MPRMSKYTEDQIKGFLAEAFGATCGGEGEGVGTEAVSEREGFSVSLLLAWKRKYFASTVKSRTPRKAAVRTPAKAAVVSNGHAAPVKASPLGTQLRKMFADWVLTQI